MKKNINLILIAALSATMFFAANACKKKTTTTTDAPKTLTKSFVSGKTWHTKNNTVSHIFNANGTYSNFGTWAWLNNSDSMLIDFKTGGLKETWYFEWSTEHEFSAKPSKKSAYQLFKDFKW